MPENANNNKKPEYDFISKENQIQHMEDYNKGKQEEITKMYAGKPTNEGLSETNDTANANKQEQDAFYKTLRSNGIFEKSDMDFNSTFYRFPRNDPYNYVDGAREYLFITKVDLPLLSGGNDSKTGGLSEEAQRVPYFDMLWESPGYRKSVFANLCKSLNDQPNSKSPFINILSNRKTSNLDIPDITVDAVETNVNAHGTRILYPQSSLRSDEDVDFTLEFEDTPNLDIYHLFKAYDVYRKYKKEGLLGPGVYIQNSFGGVKFDQTDGTHEFPDLDTAQYKNVTAKIKDEIMRNARSVRNFRDFSSNNPIWDTYTNYIANKILYDHFGIYKFLVANDGYTILFACKIIGCYPSSIPRSAFSEIPQGGPLKLSIGFKVSGWIEDSNISVIAKEFNDLIIHATGNSAYVNGGGELFEPFYQMDDWDGGFAGISQDAVSYPFIRRAPEEVDGYVPYYLMWIK